MCGLSGAFALGRYGDGPHPSELARAMAERLAHRGPDDAGLWSNSRGDVALGHQRLSIIDTSSAGHQPMTSHDGRWTIAYNGELYNTPDLRQRLNGDRDRWNGHSDTEVLLEMIARHGVQRAVELAVGMFALAVYDREHDEFWMARDRFGEKPLYYHLGDRCLVVASELSALRASPTVPSEIDRCSLVEMLEGLSVRAPYTILEGVRKLEPGTLARVDRTGRLRVSRYFDPLAPALARESVERTDDEALEEFQQLFQRVVRSRMVSDVPLGAFLSGGVDSSLVVAMMQASSSQATRTFTIGFEAEELNEAPAARMIAQRLGTEHQEWIVTGSDALAVVPQLGGIYDEPFADSSQIPTILVSRFAHQGLTVALTGDGGDELFGGYERYSLFERVDRMRRGPAGLRRSVARVAKSIDPDTFERIARRTPRRLLPPALRNRTGRRVHSAAEMLAADCRTDVYEMLLLPHTRGEELTTLGHRRPRSERVGQLEHLPAIELGMAVDSIDYLPNDILTKVDRASMSTSLETRAPILDPDLHEFAWSLRPDQRHRDGISKWLLRESVRRHVPEIADLPKRGFGVPLDHWLRTELREWADDLLAPDRLAADGLLESGAVRGLWDRHCSEDVDASAELWPVLMFRSWQDASL